MISATIFRRFSWVFLLLSFSIFLTSPCKSAEELEPGKPVERSLSIREVHTYRVRADAGQYLRFELQPNGLDLTAGLLSPTGDRIAEVLNRAGEERIIRISAAVVASGYYQFQ